MKIELKHLAGYLPYELRMKNKTTNMPLTGVYLDELNDPQFGFDDTFKPILRPLSDLTKEIEVNGEKFVPAFRTQLHFDKSLPLVHNGRILLENRIVTNTISYSDMQYLISLHFDVFGLIENGLAIDINTL